MNTRMISRRALVAALSVTLAACGGIRVRNDAALQELRKSPGNAPQRNVTDFSAGLRCMDETLFAFGTRDVVMLVEELQDQTHQLGAGTREMMVSAISDMTRRSRAVRLVTFGQDNQTIVSLLQQLEKRTPFGVLPQYDIRGAVTQFDQDVLRRDASLGGTLTAVFSANAAANSAFSVLGFDASVIRVPDLTLIPGVTSKNTVVVARDSKGLDNGQAILQKGLINFSMSVNRQSGVAQALRNMVELASIELVGKLTRVPYWNCLGLPKDSPETKREVDDWFLSMRDAADVNKFYQEQLRVRKFFDGPLDGKPSEALDQALAAYKTGLRLPADAPTDARFFAQFLASPVPPAPPAPFTVKGGGDKPADAGDGSAATPARDEPATLSVIPLKPMYKVNDEIELAIEANRAGYLYCYTQAAAGPVKRVFPNREVRDPRIEPKQTLLLPLAGGFKMVAEKAGVMKFACVHAPREIYNDLPPPLRWGDFEDIKLSSFAEIRDAFQKTAKATVLLDEATVQVTP